MDAWYRPGSIRHHRHSSDAVRALVRSSTVVLYWAGKSRRESPDFTGADRLPVEPMGLDRQGAYVAIQPPDWEDTDVLCPFGEGVR
jgi:hypothetical protein